MSDGLRLCTDCIHRRAPRPLRLLSVGSGLSPGRIRAATEELRLEHQRIEIENRRVQEGYPFTHHPQSQPWCARFTLDGARLAVITRALLEGDDAVVEQARQDGLDWRVDTANGKVLPIYDLCGRRNKTGRCPDFSPHDGARA
jgi:hypothetical protein